MALMVLTRSPSFNVLFSNFFETAFVNGSLLNSSTLLFKRIISY